jgi:excisionase family DNA binding protein
MRDWADDVVRGLPGLLTQDEACAALKISRSTMRKLVSDGRLTPVRHAVGGSARALFTRAGVARYLRSLPVGGMKP